MTLQEHYDQSKMIFFHGFEDGYYLIAFEKGGEVFHFTAREVKEFNDGLYKVADSEGYKKMEEASRMVVEELAKRLHNANTFCLLYILLTVAILHMSYVTVSHGKPYGLLFFGGVFLLSAWRLCRHMQERKVFRDYLENLQKLYD